MVLKFTNRGTLIPAWYVDACFAAVYFHLRPRRFRSQPLNNPGLDYTRPLRAAFFNSKYHGAPRPEVVCIHECRIADTKDPRVCRADYMMSRRSLDSKGVGSQHSCIALGSAVVPKPLRGCSAIHLWLLPTERLMFPDGLHWGVPSEPTTVLLLLSRAAGFLGQPCSSRAPPGWPGELFCCLRTHSLQSALRCWASRRPPFRVQRRAGSRG